MGSNCCQQRRLEDCVIQEQTIVPIKLASEAAIGQQGYEPINAASFAAESEIAAQLALDLDLQEHRCTTLIPVLYDLQDMGLETPRHICAALHRKTGMMRLLATFKKPLGEMARKHLQTHLHALQRLSARSQSLARILDVFGDYSDVHLLLEHCCGGTVCDRILARDYFTEQETTVLVRHVLEAVSELHAGGLYHGCLSPDSFHFLNDNTHAPLKLVEFGLEMKCHRWGSLYQNSSESPPMMSMVPSFNETCKVVFLAPENAPPCPAQPSKSNEALTSELDSPAALLCDSYLLGTHQPTLPASFLEDRLRLESRAADQKGQISLLESEEVRRDLQAADSWAIGAIAYLLLCGYPPFVAPTRGSVLSRIHKGAVSFDFPFWSKISEEAKSFISSCLQPSCRNRPSVHELLNHIWISNLAETAVSGSMFSSFGLNLRRFNRTSLVENYVVNALATRLNGDIMRALFQRCKEIDPNRSGFVSASDFNALMASIGYPEIGEAFRLRFLRGQKNPGESYVDYLGILDSVYLRQHRVFEEVLWSRFSGLAANSSDDGIGSDGWLPISDIGKVLDDNDITSLLLQEIPGAKFDARHFQAWLSSNIQEYCSSRGMKDIEFYDLVDRVWKLVHIYDGH